MRLQITRSANAECCYIVESFRKNGKNTSRVVEKLGNLDQVRIKAGDQDPYEWAEAYAAKLTKEKKEGTRLVLIPLNQAIQIPKDEIQRYNGGYLFLQKIYNELKLREICKAIGRRRKYDFDLNAILSRLVYCRIVHPSSKLSTYEYSQHLLESPNFDLHQIYRALSVIAEESDYIQEKLYLNSKSVVDRNTDILYYDCTNYFFEIEQEEGLKQYGASKENRPLPIVEMGLLMDGNGIPLAFCNSRKNRDFITATSVKKLPKERRERLLQQDGWKVVGGDSKKTYNLAEIDADENAKTLYYDRTFYKEEWFIDEVEIYDEELQKTVKRNLSQRLILTFSFKYKAYLQAIRDRRIERAKKLIKQGDKAVNRRGRNDVRDYIQEVAFTETGEVAEHKAFVLNESAIFLTSFVFSYRKLNCRRFRLLRRQHRHLSLRLPALEQLVKASVPFCEIYDHAGKHKVYEYRRDSSLNTEFIAVEQIAYAR